MLPPDEEQQRRKLELVQAESRKLAELAVETALSMTYQGKMDPAFVGSLLATITAVHIKNS